MVFLNPLVLFGLAAAAIPLILHLLNLRKLRTIEFSTLTFLKELQQTRIRRLKLRQLLLLLIRTLLIAFIVLAFARPALHGTMFGGFGSHANSTIVFILDDSFSMMGADEHGEYFKQAKDAAGKLVDLLKEGDEAYLLKLSDLPRASVSPATHDFGALRTVIREARATMIRRSAGEAIRLSESLLRDSRNANKEVYLISDMQQTLFSDGAAAPKAPQDSTFDPSVKLFTVEIGSKPVPNLGIDSVEVRTQIFEKNKPVKVYASIRNFSGVPVRDYVASVFLDGARAAQGNISAGAWESTGKEFSVTPKKSGFARGYAELESDALEPDNRRYFTLAVPERIGVAMVSGGAQDVRYISLAVQAGRTGEGGGLLVNVSESTPQKFPFVNLKDIDVLVISNVRSFSAADADKIAAFVKRGGGCIIFPGSDIDRDHYNSVLLPPLGIPPLEGLTTNDARTPLSFRAVDLDHPLFATMFEEQGRTKGAVESPSILKALRHHTGRQGRTLISLSDGGAFLSEYRAGGGRVLLFAVAPDLSWSDFPIKGLFAPLIYRSLIYLSSLGEAIPAYTVGDEPAVSLRNSPDLKGGAYSLVSPDGSGELIHSAVQTQGISSTATLFRLRRLITPGFYEIIGGADTLTVFGVNTDRRESDTRKISGEDLGKFWKRAGISAAAVRSIDRTDQLQTTILQLRYGVELWKHCIGLALLLALLEMAVARDGRAAAQHPSPTAA